MKKLLLLTFIIITFIAKSQTWVYHPMPESNATWNFQVDAPCFPIISLYQDYSITITGDTIIGSKTYHKLFTPFVWNSYSGTSGCSIAYPGYKGAFRQDSIAKKVFYVPYDTTEYLLYDFNMQVGDTLKGCIASYPYDTVISIDSILVGSGYRKIWHLNQYQGIYFIEGIGSTYGLTVGSAGNAIGTFPFWGLTCFIQNGSTLYPNTTTSCPLITSINSLEKISNQLSVFPNPSNGSFSIETENIELKEIRISDLLGKEIFHQDKIYQTKTNVDGLNSGTYILSAVDKDNHSINKKIIVLPH